MPPFTELEGESDHKR